MLLDWDEGNGDDRFGWDVRLGLVSEKLADLEVDWIETWDDIDFELSSLDSVFLVVGDDFKLVDTVEDVVGDAADLADVTTFADVVNVVDVVVGGGGGCDGGDVVCVNVAVNSVGAGELIISSTTLFNLCSVSHGES